MPDPEIVPTPAADNWYSRPADDVAAVEGVDPNEGLPPAEAADRLESVAANMASRASE